jgi:prophage antirepressor-like protein
MSQSIIPFQFHTSKVRVVIRDGEPWFFVADVAKALGYCHAPDVLRWIPTHQKNTVRIPHSNTRGNPNLSIISEPGLYRLVLRSRRPDAVAFTDWVTGEVLPSIRKTGAYAQTESAKPAQIESTQRTPAPKPLDLQIKNAIALTAFGLDELHRRSNALNAVRQLLRVPEPENLDRDTLYLGGVWRNDLAELIGLIVDEMQKSIEVTQSAAETVRDWAIGNGVSA